MVRDMTEGKPLSLILQFCIPMLIGNLFQQLYNMVDSIIVGRFVGVEALAAVGSTGAISFLVLGFVIGTSSGFAIPVAQCFGAGDYKAMRKHIANAAYWAVIITVIVTVITMIFTRQLLIFMKTPDDIIDYAYSYIIVIFAGIAVAMLYNFLAAILRALGDSRTPLLFLGIASVLNIILDLIFVLAFKLECFGVGLATVIAQGISAFCCVLFIRKRYPILQFEKDELEFDGACSKKLLSMGLPMAFQFSITAIGSIILQTAVNTLGSSVVAAVTVAGKIQMIAMQPMETMGVALATYGGQNLGAGKIDRIKKGISQSLGVLMIYAVVAFFVVAFLGQYIALLFLDSKETAIIAYVKHFLTINGAFYPLLGILFLYRNSLQGLGYSFLPMFAGVSELLARAGVAFLLVGTFGFDAICFASPAAWTVAAVFLIIVYFISIKKLTGKFEEQKSLK